MFILFDYYVSWEECGADRCVCYKLQSRFDQFTVKLNPLSGFKTITKTLGKIYAMNKKTYELRIYNELIQNDEHRKRSFYAII